MRIRLYLDEDSMDRALVRALRAREVDVLTAVEVGLIATPDSQHLSYASDKDRVLFTYNLVTSAPPRLVDPRGRQHSGSSARSSKVTRLAKLFAASSI